VTVESLASARHPCAVQRFTLTGIVFVAGCATHSPPLAPAGSIGDDGVGVLAKASVRVEVDGVDDGPPGIDRYYSGDEDYDPVTGLGGFGYGGYGYGGYGSGGLLSDLGGLANWDTPAPPGATQYQSLPVGELGTIAVELVWSGSAGIAWPAGCAAARTAVRGGPVVGAVAYLEPMTRGRTPMPASVAVVTSSGCGLWPLTQVVGAAPALVTIENRSGTAAAMAVGGGESIDVGAGGSVEVIVERNGALMVTASDRAPAWIVVAPHPYYEVTDDRGRLVMPAVPPGSYTLVVWYPPLVTSVEGNLPTWSAPVEIRRPVEVGPMRNIAVAVSVAPPQ
jgi:hypothetical protein